MRISIFAHGGRGDIWPLVALGWHLARCGNDVTIAVQREFGEFCERAGLCVVPLPFDLVDWLGTVRGQRLLSRGGVRLVHDIQREYNLHADEFDDAYAEAARGADALVGSLLTLDRAISLGDSLRIPVAIVHQVPVAPSRSYGSLPLTRGRLRFGSARLASHALHHRIYWRGAAKSANAFRRKLGLPRSQPMYRRLLDPSVLGLHTLSPSLFPRPSDWAENLKITGAWQMPDGLRDDLGEALPSDLEAWLDAGDPPIFFGFGSMPVLDPEPLLEDIGVATSELGRRAILSENCVPAGTADSLPANLRVVGTVNHDRLFPRCAAAIHHGGIGSTHASLRAGRPTMVCSVFADQPWWGEHMKRLGVGTHVPFRKLDRGRLNAGLQTLLDPEVETRARRLGAAIMREGDGLPTAAQLLVEWLRSAEPLLCPAVR